MPPPASGFPAAAWKCPRITPRPSTDFQPLGYILATSGEGDSLLRRDRGHCDFQSRSCPPTPFHADPLSPAWRGIAATIVPPDSTQLQVLGYIAGYISAPRGAWLS